MSWVPRLCAAMLAAGCQTSTHIDSSSSGAEPCARPADLVVSDGLHQSVVVDVGRTRTAEVDADRKHRARPCPDVVEGMSCVPGTFFMRGKDDDPHECDQDDAPADRRSSSTPAATIWVDTFLMDATEVTVDAYLGCVKAGKCPNSGPVYADYRGPRQPITGVPWHDAATYCESVGKRLPTEAEWELAARGPDGEVYPWGNDPVTCEHAVIMDETGRSCGNIKRRGKNPEKGRVLEVGSRPAGRYGLFDMIGNAEEWVADWWTPTYSACGAACLGDNPKGPCDGKAPCEGMAFRGVRGGSWYWPAAHATGYHRRRNHPDNHPYHHFGFRCAKSLDDEGTP